MITIDNPGPQIDTSRIAEVEAAIGGKLPASYKDFLLKNNGGRPVPDTIDIDRLPGSPTDIQIFFGIGRGVETSNLSWNIKFARERLPDHRLLPIACDSGGNIFCLGIPGQFSGGIVYCDLTGAEPVKPYEVAPTFEAFLEKIRTWGDA
ncbi:SMI1/KNR4 family protein [Bradyrhizobium sp. AUGA SZCCT0177]|uniref:SMI1/KNR4 family protein n=1 Tax=Bradyrhizobium sp. AUGA SZCCT0177 TaxID=2807665 RepID=UPI001BA9E9B5|nr:SMI1/KNR4 family protein [Bradyrhizobium sp. AUGA SZCCT0177]MBR1282608.1 SMI1/KNR4 family protein [Bradyrhizobium sp. AUGA SZCCT0177]